MLLLALVVIPLSAQRPTKYRVQRGETIASIARKFGMTEKELKRINEDLSYCYAGMIILVKDKRGAAAEEHYDDYADDGGYTDDRIDMGAPATMAAPLGDPLLEEAHQLEQMGKFKQAVKCYDKVLDRGPSAELFYQRGVCYFQMKKWKKAIEDFERVTRSNDATHDLRSRSEDFIDEAYMRWDKAKERRANTWAGIIGGVVAVGAVADALSGPSSKGDHKGKDGPRRGKDGPRDKDHKNGKQGQAQGKPNGHQGGSPRTGQADRGNRNGQNARQGGDRGNRDGQNARQGGNRGGGNDQNARQGGERGSRDGQSARQGGNRGNRDGQNARQGGNRGNRDGQNARQGGNGNRGNRDGNRDGNERRRDRQ